MGAESSSIQAKLIRLLGGVVEAGKLGELFDSECMYKCFPGSPKSVRKPDVSFVLRERLPGGQIPRGMFRIRPDLVVEVISHRDEYEEVDEKIADYLDAGVPLIWVVTPRTRTVLVYLADGTACRLRHTDDLTADPLIPGFRVRIGDFLPEPPPKTEKDAAEAAEPPPASQPGLA